METPIVIVKNPGRLARMGAEIFCQAASASVQLKGRFAVALSGGSTPREMHRLLADPPYADRIPWQQTHVFWADERMVPVNDPASNYGAARRDFLAKIPTLSDRVHPMPVHLPPAEGAGAYQREMERVFKPAGNRYPVFDLILLGVGTDGHTASLFPGKNTRETKGRWVQVVKGGNPKVLRLSLTYSLMNRARQIVFLVCGREKASIVREIIVERNSSLPAAKIRPLNGQITWLIDSAAAARLQDES